MVFLFFQSDKPVEVKGRFYLKKYGGESSGYFALHRINGFLGKILGAKPKRFFSR